MDYEKVIQEQIELLLSLQDKEGFFLHPIRRESTVSLSKILIELATVGHSLRGTGLSGYKTHELLTELVKREGVDQYTIEPYTEIKIEIDKRKVLEDTGPACILHIYD